MANRLGRLPREIRGYQEQDTGRQEISSEYIFSDADGAIICVQLIGKVTKPIILLTAD